MRIGILTFHDEVNYGSLLQAYAMQSALIQLGHDAVIIDRWFQPDQERLYGIWRHRSVKDIVKLILGVISFNGTISKYIRMWRSRVFIRTYLHLTTYHFHDWKDAPEELGVDLVVVGSDQVWQPGAQPDVYLLNYLKNVPGISYAASFGVERIPVEKQSLYLRGFKNFKAISVREKEGQKIVEGLSTKAEHVVDPTLLVDPKTYNVFIKRNRKKHIACYFLSEDFSEYIFKLGKFARSNNVSVDFFAQDFEIWSVRALVKCKIAQLLFPINVCFASGPEDFVTSISSSDCVFTNSFHALMFSLIFRKNVRVVKPTAPWRKGMSARMQEFTERIVSGPLIAETLDDAIESYHQGVKVSYNEEEILHRVNDSMSWLMNAIGR